MYPCFDIEGISSERLLREWKWLVHGEFTLLAVNAFGDLFLQDVHSSVHRLDVTSGKISLIAASGVEFREVARDLGNKKDWFLEELAEQAERKGCSPGKGQCVGGKIPFVFKQSASMQDNMYERISMSVFRSWATCNQMKDVPDGGQVRIRIQPRPDQPDPVKN
jgi:hypothetical protein